MSLTGLPLLLAALVGALATGAATVWLWSRPVPWRPAVRALGVLLTEALLVCGVGLIVNRSEQFYPSWAALRGETGTTATAAARSTGRLDHGLHAGAVPWRPAGLAAWRLAVPPSLLIPPGYAERPGLTFPVVLDLAGGRGAKPLPDTVVVHTRPSPHTTPAELAALCDQLAGELRVTRQGWAVVVPIRHAGVALRLVHQDPGRFAAIALVGTGFPPQTGLALKVERTYSQALAWAAGETAAPLAAPIELPPASVP